VVKDKLRLAFLILSKSSIFHQKGKKKKKGSTDNTPFPFLIFFFLKFVRFLIFSKTSPFQQKKKKKKKDPQTRPHSLCYFFFCLKAAALGLLIWLMWDDIVLGHPLTTVFSALGSWSAFVFSIHYVPGAATFFNCTYSSLIIYFFLFSQQTGYIVSSILSTRISSLLL